MTRRIFQRATLLLIVASLLGGCASMSRQGKGTAVGAAGGALLGALIFKNDVAGALLGAAIGGAAGNLIGRHMDKQAQELKQQIPEAGVERVAEGINITFDSELLFDKGRATLSDAGIDALHRLGKVLVNYPEQYVLCEGHTSADPALAGPANEKANMQLSEKRAKAVAARLEEVGVSEAHLVEKWYGGERPKFPNDTEESRAKNRRVEIGIIANEAMRERMTQESSAQGNQ